MKKKVAVVFGGQAKEHDISCLSVVNVVAGFDMDKYELHLIGITLDGNWLSVDNVEAIKDGSWEQSKTVAIISPDHSKSGIWKVSDGLIEFQEIDVIFPVLHGLYGEDGTVQGLFELSGIPYVGCGVLASAASLDKITTKIFADRIGVRQARYVCDISKDCKTIAATVSEVEKNLPYPVFVKPSTAGSSQGVSKATNADELVKAIEYAKEFDTRVLIEEGIFGREIECGVLGGDENIIASKVGEIQAAAEFYDFDAKYNNQESKTIVDPADLSEEVKEKVRANAIAIFKEVGAYGLSRVDFFVENGTNEVVFNEINTFPGFTNISMYPMLLEDAGYSRSDLIDKLIELAFCR